MRVAGGRQQFAFDGQTFEDGCLVKVVSLKGLRWGDDVTPSLPELERFKVSLSLGLGLTLTLSLTRTRTRTRTLTLTLTLRLTRWAWAARPTTSSSPPPQWPRAHGSTSRWATWSR